MTGCGGGDDEVYDPVKVDIKVLNESKDLEERRVAAHRLGSQNEIPEDAIPELMKFAKNEQEDETIRRRVIWALGKTKSTEVSHELGTLMNSLPKDSPMRKSIADALNNINRN